MAKELTIAQALKYKKKVIMKLTSSKNKVQQSNCFTSIEAADYDANHELAEVRKLEDELIDLKVRIQTANVPILDKIYRLSELKDFSKFLQGIPIRKGKGSIGYGEQSQIVTYENTIQRTEIDKLKEETENKIEKLQEELDQFNHVTKI